LDIDRYLDRIGYHGPRRPTLDVLRRLHFRHLLTVPFENLDIYLGNEIILDPERFYQKIVVKGRGGYCYELNGCFALLLQSLGFKVSMLSARVAREEGGFSPEFDHMTLLIQLKQPWLADVGFGDSFTRPVQIDTSLFHADREYFYRVSGPPTVKVVSRKRRLDGPWIPEYSFSMRPRKLDEFATMNRHQQTSPQSHFTHGPLISQLTKSGRVTLTGKKLTLTREGRRVQLRLKREGEFGRLLQKHFRLKLDARGSSFPNGNADSIRRRGSTGPLRESLGS
jgi:N-hydroxyarylamine O-acetyltransferase